MRQDEEIRTVLLPVVLKYGLVGVSKVLQDINAWAAGIAPIQSAPEEPKPNKRKRKKRLFASQDGLEPTEFQQTLLETLRGYEEARIPDLKTGKLRKASYSKLRHNLVLLEKGGLVTSTLNNEGKFYKLSQDQAAKMDQAG